eukprot:jgi/Botrbrau1/6185/Bobra.0344s0025.1
MSHQNQQERPASPPRCKANCGFFGNSANGGYCSKCVKNAEAVELLNAYKEPGRGSPLLQPRQVNSESSAVPLEPVDDVADDLPEVKRIIEDVSLEAGLRSDEADRTEIVSDEPCGVAVEQKNPGRCWTCNKKIGLTGFQCRCKLTFCSQHRLPETHQCAVDFKSLGREQLAKSNPLIQATKLDRV